MYVTRGLSLYRKDPSSLSIRVRDYAPNLGVIVMSDEETEEQDSYCWGLREYKKIKSLPFPQNKILKIVHSSEYRDQTVTRVWFLPVLQEPLSAHRYYIIRAKGNYKGKACTSSKKVDMLACCYSEYVNDQKPRPLDYRDIYQQFEIHRYHGGGFYAKSVAYDGIPPKFLKKKGWEVRASSRSIRGQLKDALGLDDTVRASLPPPPTFPLPPHNQHASVVVGRWYCPFVFIREEAKLWRHMKKSLFYEITLEQYWEEIFSTSRGNVIANEEDNEIVVDAMVKTEEAIIYGMEPIIEVNPVLGFMSFIASNDNDGSSSNAKLGRKVRLGLSLAVFEAMRGIQIQRGWMENQEVDVRVERIEEVRMRKGENGGWKRFGCYVLVESFFVRRMDGVLIIKYNFRHSHKIQCKWD